MLDRDQVPRSVAAPAMEPILCKATFLVNEFMDILLMSLAACNDWHGLTPVF